KFGQDLCHRDGVGDVGLTTLAKLPLVPLCRREVRALNDREITLGVICPHRAQQMFQIVTTDRPGEDAWNQPPQTRWSWGGGRNRLGHLLTSPRYCSILLRISDAQTAADSAFSFSRDACTRASCSLIAGSFSRSNEYSGAATNSVEYAA